MKSVVICGSRRFETEIRKFARDLIKLGVDVYEPWLHKGGDEWNKLSEQYKTFTLLGLTHDYFYKLKMGDVVYLYNKGGYAGVSSTLELGYAVALGKPVYVYSNEDEELARKVLFREVTKTPKELLKKLK